MSDRVLRLSIHAGEKTCAAEPGVFCRFLSVHNFGTDFYCHVFEARPKELNGWLRRLPECLEVEEEKE